MDIPFLDDLRQTVERANHALTPVVFEHIESIFQTYFQDGRSTPAEITNEYCRDEFLLVVDESGQPSGGGDGLLRSYRTTPHAHSHFGAWFQEAVRSEGGQLGQPVLLAARWLCHLAGLRHGTVEIFIDPPDIDGFTLVQVRGLDKFEAPGAFDIPCAGHISGVDLVEASLQKELAEELNLTLADLRGLRLLGQYHSHTSSNGQDLSINVEYRFLFRAELKAEAVSQIRFTDGEVAGLGVFSLSELRELARRYPERVASGLSGALPYYD